MKIITMMILTLSALAACNSSKPSFKKMSELELVEYNSSVNYWDKIHCEEATRIGSHMRKRTCVTYRALIGGGLTTLETASSSSSIVRGQAAPNLRNSTAAQLPLNEDIEGIGRFVEIFKKRIIRAESLTKE